MKPILLFFALVTSSTLLFAQEAPLVTTSDPLAPLPSLAEPAPLTPPAQALEPSPAQEPVPPQKPPAPNKGETAAPKAQEKVIHPHNPDSAPQILSDLVQRQIVKESTLDVDFFLVDQDKIIQVFINGEKQPFAPATTVVLSKRFVLDPGVTQIKIIAQDEAGNQRTKLYLIGFDPNMEDPAQAWKLEYLVSLTHELDSNPTADLSTPIPIAGVNLQGVVDDSQQADWENTAVAAIYAKQSQFNLAGGGIARQYQKSVNQLYNADLLFFSAGYWIPFGKDKIIFNFGVLDYNLGQGDYMQSQTLSTILLAKSRDIEGSYTHRLSVNQSAKTFANPLAQAGHETRLEWIYEEEAIGQRDLFRSHLSLGQSLDEQPASLNQYISYSAAWRNTWDSGLTIEFDFGLALRQFPSDAALIPNLGGDTRLDFPLNYGLKLGYKYQNYWVRGFYSNLINLSNVSMYERSVTGVSLQCLF